MNLEELTDAELTELHQQVVDERTKRAFLASVEREADVLARRYQEAIGREDGDEWAQPKGAHDAYREGAVVTHEGKSWVSLIPANVWAPGVSGWREHVEDDPSTGGPGVPEWVQPSGHHDAYKAGDQVRFEGTIYESLIDGNTWSPSAYPTGWKVQ